MKRILYVDDETLIRDASKQFLELAGYTVDDVSSGRDALEILQHTSYDAIISDYLMPDMNGIELLKTVRSEIGDIPFILFTGKGREEVVIEAIEYGVDFYVQKGGNPEPLFADLIHKITRAINQRESERKSQKNADRLRIAQEIGKTGCWEYDIKTGEIWGSEEAFRLFGLHRPDGEISLDIIEACILEKERIHQALVDLIAGDSDYNIEYLIHPADGSAQKVIHSVARLEKDAQGNPARTMGIIRDITERSRTEKALYESEILLRGLFDTMPSGAAIYSVQNDGSRGSDYIISDFNRASLLIEGKRKEEVVGRSLADLRPNIDEFGLISIFQKVWETGETVFYPAKIYVDDAYTNWYENYVFRLPTGQIVSIYNDVTETKRAEEALRQSEERLRLTLDATNDGIWDWNVPTGSAIFSPRWYTMLGYEPGEMPPTYTTWRSLIHPDDLLATELRIADHIQKKEDGYTVEFRMQTKIGDWIWILTRGKVIEWDEAGNPVRMVGTHTDISRRKQAEIERERLNGELARSNEQLAEAYEELSGSEEELRHQYNTLAATEEHLRETSEYLENLITYANVPIIVWDPANIITRINHAFENLIGRSAEELIGNSLDILFPGDQIEHSIRLIETTRVGVRWDSVEIILKHQDGSPRTVLWNSSTLYSSDGTTPVATIAQGQDITARRRIERENEISILQIQKNLAQLSILNDEIRNPLMVILMCTEMADHDQVTNIIVEQTHYIDEMVRQLDQRWIESEGVLTMLRKNYQIDASSSTDQIIRDLTGGGPGTLDPEVSDGSSFTLHHLLAQEIQAELFSILDSIDASIFVADLVTYDLLYLNKLGRRLFGDIAGKKCYQVIQKGQSGPCPFCTNHLLTDEFGSTGVHQKETQNTRNGRWYECRDRTIRWSDGRLVHLHVATDITERKLHEDTLRENEYTFRKLYEESSDPILLEEEDRFVECNQAALTLLGMATKEQLIGSTPMDISPEYQPDGRLSAEAAHEYIDRAYAEGLCRFEWMVRRVNGTLVFLEVSLLPIIFKGEKMLHITWRDITDRKHIEQSVRESEAKYLQVINTMQETLSVIDFEGNFLFTNDAAAYNVSGGTPGEIIGRNIRSFVPLPQADGLIEKYQTVITSGQPLIQDVKVTLKNRDFWFHNQLKPINYGVTPVQAVLSLSLDITERKQTEDALKQAREWLGITFRAAKAGAWDWDFLTGSLTWSPEFFDLFGLPPDTPASFDSWLSVLHPDDRASSLAMINQSVRDHVSLWNEYRILLPDGRIRWIAAGGNTTYNEQDKPLRMSGVCIDITDKKLSEESLYEAIQKLRLLTGLTRHDIFNQVSAIQILQERALQTPDLTKIREFITLAQEGVNQIEATIQFTREYENFGTVSCGWLHIHPVIQAAKGEIPPGTVTIENQVAQTLEVFTDPIIRKVFSTLIDNAIRHGGEITRIRFSSHSCENALIISCEDDGAGVPSEEKGVIFEHGYGKHTGIGLFLASEILSITGLSIMESGVPGKGARFEILVPAGKFRINPHIPDTIDGEKP